MTPDGHFKWSGAKGEPKLNHPVQMPGPYNCPYLELSRQCDRSTRKESVGSSVKIQGCSYFNTTVPRTRILIHFSTSYKILVCTPGTRVSECRVVTTTSVLLPGVFPGAGLGV